MKRVVLSPNPYRDRGFRILRAAYALLRQSGVECVCALPFESEQPPELPQELEGGAEQLTMDDVIEEQAQAENN